VAIYWILSLKPGASQSTAESRLEDYSAEVNLATKAGSRSHKKMALPLIRFLGKPAGKINSTYFCGQFLNRCDINKNLRVVGAVMRASNSKSN
jgi:hypothetical protein